MLGMVRGGTRLSRQKAGKKRSLHSSGKGTRLADIQIKRPVCATHDYSGVFGINRKN